ncbi:MAG: PLP-dependent transferase [Candidatus Gastranaerophilales bacterium]|nr:PLP-dependent transferase [Candidatus Gastranaerophilales bacterium]
MRSCTKKSSSIKIPHASIPAEQRKLIGINDNLIRLSVGIEDIKDLISDLDYALERL